MLFSFTVFLVLNASQSYFFDVFLDLPIVPIGSNWYNMDWWRYLLFVIVEINHGWWLVNLVFVNFLPASTWTANWKTLRFGPTPRSNRSSASSKSVATGGDGAVFDFGQLSRPILVPPVFNTTTLILEKIHPTPNTKINFKDASLLWRA